MSLAQRLVEYFSRLLYIKSNISLLSVWTHAHLYSSNSKVIRVPKINYLWGILKKISLWTSILWREYFIKGLMYLLRLYISNPFVNILCKFSKRKWTALPILGKKGLSSKGTRFKSPVFWFWACLCTNALMKVLIRASCKLWPW